MRRLAATAMLGVAGVAAQSYQPGPQVITFFSTVDDTDQPYGLYVPKNFDPAKRYPLVVSLHGAYSNHRLNLRRVLGQGNRPGETDAEATRYFPQLPDVPYFVASPLARGTLGYQGIPEQDVYDVLADMKRRFPIDEDRVYLTGLSMGGGGALWLGLTRPDIWAAIAPVCPAAPPRTEWFASNVLNVPVHLFQGALDPVVPPEGTREWKRRLEELGTAVVYTEYPNARHNSWDNAYAGAAIFDWFSHYRRNRFPDRVRFSTDRYRYSSAYWVRIDRLVPGTPARIDATFEDPNRIAIETQGIDGLTLLLGGHSKFDRRKAVRVRWNGRELQRAADGGGSVSFGTKPGSGDKRPGLEGPIADAVAARHIYVFGTGGNPSAEELRERRSVAEKAAEWSTPALRLLLTFEVKADKEVRETDLRRANLFLFGTRETNSVIDRFSDRLPLKLNAGAADYGLIFVAPAAGRYVVVNSGLPWWTGMNAAARPGLGFLPPATVLNSFNDYVLFKGGLDNPVVEGRFDPDWRVPPAAARKMAATGAVEVTPK